MTRVLVCLGKYKEAEQLEFYQEEIEPDLVQGGYRVQCTTQAEVLKQLASIQPDYLVLIAMKKQSSAWNIARRLRDTRQKGDPYILMIIGKAPEDSPDDPFYYASLEYQALYDSYWPGWGFTDWLEDFQTFGPITWSKGASG